MVALIYFAVVLLVLIGLVLIYNGLVSTRNDVQNAWKQIDVQLKRRHDLIPNLVSTVKGAMSAGRSPDRHVEPSWLIFVSLKIISNQEALWSY